MTILPPHEKEKTEVKIPLPKIKGHFHLPAVPVICHLVFRLQSDGACRRLCLHIDLSRRRTAVPSADRTGKESSIFLPGIYKYSFFTSYSRKYLNC